MLTSAFLSFPTIMTESLSLSVKCTRNYNHHFLVHWRVWCALYLKWSPLQVLGSGEGGGRRQRSGHAGLACGGLTSPLGCTGSNLHRSPESSIEALSVSKLLFACCVLTVGQSQLGVWQSASLCCRSSAKALAGPCLRTTAAAQCWPTPCRGL
jgi:hypothetical protein